MSSDGGHGDSRFLADTMLADGALLLVEDLRKELTREWPGMRISSPQRVVQVRMKSGKGIKKSIFFDRGFLLPSKRKPAPWIC